MKNLFFIVIIIFTYSGLFAQMAGDINSMPDEPQRFITLQGYAINSIGHFEETWKSATGFYIGYGKIYASDWALVYQTGYFSFKHNEEADFSGDPSYTVIPLAIGGRYYIVRDLLQPYLMAMTGINVITEKYTFDGKVTDRTSGKLHFQVGAGLAIGLTHNLEIEVSGKYNSHVLDASAPYNMTGLEYGLAVNWFLQP